MVQSRASVGPARHDRFRFPAGIRRAIGLATSRSSRSGYARAAARYRIRPRLSERPVKFRGPSIASIGRGAPPCQWCRKSATQWDTDLIRPDISLILLTTRRVGDFRRFIRQPRPNPSVPAYACFREEPNAPQRLGVVLTRARAGTPRRAAPSRLRFGSGCRQLRRARERAGWRHGASSARPSLPGCVRKDASAPGP